MPKYICAKCQQELWGWGVEYQQRAGSRIVCPDCGGNLVIQKEGNGQKQGNKLHEETTAA